MHIFIQKIIIGGIVLMIILLNKSIYQNYKKMFTGEVEETLEVMLMFYTIDW